METNNSNNENDKYDIIPKPPSVLDELGEEKYYEISRMLVDEGKYNTGDDLSVLALCVNYARWLQAEISIKENNDLCFETESGYRQQLPEISIAKDCMKNMLTFIKEFGLTFKQRVQLKEAMLQNKDEEDSEMESMISK